MNLHACDAEWRRRHGVTFEWTRVRHERFEKDYRHILNQWRVRRRITEIVPGILFLALLLSCPLAVIRLIGLRDGPIGDPQDALISGLLIGTAATFVVLLTVAFAWRPRSAASSDPRWVLTTMSVGVDRGVLWLYRHKTLTLFTSARSFTAVEWTDHLILAFVNRTAAHAFPRDALEATDEGRQVLDWFEANWPQSSIAEVSVLRRVRRRVVSLLAILAWAVVLTLVLLGAVALWRRGSIAHWRPPRVLARPSAVVAPPPERRDAVEPPTLSGQDARDFLDRLRDPAAR